MGKDCCGNGEPSILTDPQPSSLPSTTGSVQAEKAPNYDEDFSATEFREYCKRRVDLFLKYKARQDEKLEKAKAANETIKIRVQNDDSVKEAIKGVTSSMDIAKLLDKKVVKAALSASVDGQVWDLTRPLQADCEIRILSWDDAKGKDTFWHSSSHILGEALEALYGVRLTIGPAVEEGFYYDCYYGSKTLSDADRPDIEKKMMQIVKEKQSFQRVEVTREEALDMFEENKFKVEIIGGLPQGSTITLYRSGDMVDLCRGPHLPNTGYLKAVAVSAMNRAFWRGDTKRDPLQRVYGVTFPDKESMADYKHRMEEAKKRDHRVLGTKHELFFFDKLSPGSCFFLPNGTRIYNLLIEFIREKYWEYEYEEVVTPNIYNFDLWKTSGHADHYKQNMFHFDIEKQEFGLKPMNCPGHCLMFGHRARSYRELPLRLADFGVLHRNEYSGALTGLTRVRRFQQDDAHIFCRPDQVKAEVGKCLQMLGEVYGVFGLTYTAALSTRPESRIGEEKLWDAAEIALQEALQAQQEATGQAWEMNEGDGAFYGPKIDITVYDALRRKYQCATVQLDFQLPLRFNLEYATGDQDKAYERPVIVHRAILGSVERMFAILAEHYAGKWPLWLSPRQVEISSKSHAAQMSRWADPKYDLLTYLSSCKHLASGKLLLQIMVIPISVSSKAYAEQVRHAIRKQKFFVDIDHGDNKMEKKIREAQLNQYNYILVVGEQESSRNTVNVRTRDNQRRGEHPLQAVLEVLLNERDNRSLTSLFPTAELEPSSVKSGNNSQSVSKQVREDITKLNLD